MLPPFAADPLNGGTRLAALREWMAWASDGLLKREAERLGASAAGETRVGQAAA